MLTRSFFPQLHPDRAGRRAIECLANELEHELGLVLLLSADDGGDHFLGIEPTRYSALLDPEPSLGIGDISDEYSSLPRWIGVLPYEAFRHLERPAFRIAESRELPKFSEICWAYYPTILRVRNDEWLLHGEDTEHFSQFSLKIEKALKLLEKPLDGKVDAFLRLVDEEIEDESLHHQRLGRALEHILDGDIYEINLSRRFTFAAKGSKMALFSLLAKRTCAPYSAFIRIGQELTVMANSPELCLSLSPDRKLCTVPIKGTRPRALDDSELDAARAYELDNDPKEQAELAMVIDVERNDLGKVATIGSVKLTNPPHIVAHPTIFHRQAVIEAELAIEENRESLLEAFLPSGSVTGAPKIRAMELIAELESCRRGLYTGALGYLSRGGGLNLAMAIRVLCFEKDQAYYHAGGGIVSDSNIARETAETLWKAAHLLQKLGD